MVLLPMYWQSLRVAAIRQEPHCLEDAVKTSVQRHFLVQGALCFCSLKQCNRSAFVM